MSAAWWNDYIGIPYVSRGRTRQGIDCWGLVCLIYRDRYGIELPTAGEEYDPGNPAEIAPIAGGPMRDDWREVETPDAGDVVLLRMLGYPSHIGVVTEAGRMIHAREGTAVVLERLDAGPWRHRIDGYYRHASRRQAITISGRPHPLSTQTISGTALDGATIASVIRNEAARAGAPECLALDQGHVWIEGEYIPASEWDTYKLRAGQRMEYRLLPAAKNSGFLNRLLKIVVIIVAVVVSFWNPALGLKIAAFGLLAVDLLAPVRFAQPKDASPDGVQKSRIQGGRNPTMLYGSIPVVLGQFRYTPPLAAESWIETDTHDQYLRMVVCWGYGQLGISDIRLADTSLDNFEEVTFKTLSGRTPTGAAAKSAFDALYGQDVTQQQIAIKLTTNTQIVRTISSSVDYISVALHFPSGLWYVVAEGPNTGDERPLNFKANIEVAAAGSGTWYRIDQHTYGDTTEVPSVDTQIEEAVTYTLWQWHTFVLNQYGAIVMYSGAPTDNQYADPSPELRAVLIQLGRFDYMGGFLPGANPGFPGIPLFPRLPRLQSTDIALFHVCVSDDAIVTTTDVRPSYVTGCALTYSVRDVTIASGDIDRTQLTPSQTTTIDYTVQNKDSLDIPVRFAVANGSYDVRVTLISDDRTEVNDATTNGHKCFFYRDCYYITLTGTANSRPVKPPKPLAMTAIRIRASNQLNGVVDGITGIAKSRCYDWKASTSSWVIRHTLNPASLFRYVLQHPGNAKPVADASIDLTQLAYWHTFCVTNGFTYEDVMMQGRARPLLDVLRDIAAAGRASPTLVDGKWSVIIDELRTTIVQHFTPHNSWNFQGAKLLPELPHALRVQFYNREQAYQEDERVVYADGYTSSNASLFEQITLPGVCKPKAVYRLARFHLAQMKLRPERYTLMVDAEHLICTRGDLVRVTHDVAMWGLGSGRVTAIAVSGPNDTGLTLSEYWPMKASGSSYTIRIRRDTGTSLTIAINNPGSDGEYNTVTFTTPITSGSINANDLVLFGLTGSESAELLVLGIEPDSRGNARITLCDHSPAVYDTASETVPDFASQITLPQILHRKNPAANHKPIISSIFTDERALVRGTAGNLQAGMRITWQIAPNIAHINKEITHVEAQWSRSETHRYAWVTVDPVPVRRRKVWIGPLQEGKSYIARLRYVTKDGYVGPWTTIDATTIVGRTEPPPKVTNLAVFYDDNAGLRLDWDDSDDIDVRLYEVRRIAGSTVDWANGKVVKRVKASEYRLGYIQHQTPYTYMVKAKDQLNLYSNNPASLVIQITPPKITSLTGKVVKNTIQLTWATTTGTYPIVSCELRVGGTSWATATSIGTKQGTFTTLTEYVEGTYTYRMRATDAAGIQSDAQSVTLNVKGPPDLYYWGTFTGTLT